MTAKRSILQQVAQLYHDGQYLAAYLASEPLGPLTTWITPEGRVLAGRMANNLGGTRVGRILHRLAFREYPSEPRVAYFYALTVMARRGPFRAWQFMRRYDLPTASPQVRADWISLWAHVMAIFRDFQQADEHINRALDLAPERPWIWIEKSHILECEDKYEQSIESAKKALQLQPFYRPAVQSTAHALVQLNRDEEALGLLVEASNRLQSGDLLAQLSALQTELQHFDDARKTLDRIPELYPLIGQDRGRAEWLAGRRSDAAYYAGDYESAAHWAAQADNDFHRKMVDQLRSSGAGKRIMLPVGFVRQHYDTCAPATLAAISRHWSMPADHLDVVERICYDGTPAHSERRWAEQSGFVAREFRVDWEAATALLDRQIPFTLTTVGAGYAHLQAAIGYDSRRGTLLIRDPGERHFSEFLVEELIERMQSTGPRGMVLIPQSQSSLLADILLPETEMYDVAYEVELALQRHDRDNAETAYAQLVKLDANHRLTINARGSLARYDADQKAALKCVERLLSKYPDDSNLLLAKLSLVRNLGTRAEQLRTLEEICARPNCDPLFWQRFAAELSEDVREQARVESLIRRSLRYRPVNGEALELLADIRWTQQRRDEALQLYRLAASTDEKDEARSQRFFLAATNMRQTKSALKFLRDRFRRFGSRSAFPARTLSWAYTQLEQPNDAFAVLEAAMLQHPKDGELMLHTAEVYGRFGNRKSAHELLLRAKAFTHPTAWLRAAAYSSAYEGELPESLRLWRQVAEAEPLARDANEMIASVLADVDSQYAAIDHLQQTVDRFPNNYEFRVALIEAIPGHSPEKVAAVLNFLELFPVDPWGHRELAIAYVAQGNWMDAAEAAEVAVQLGPDSPVVHYLRARIAWAENRPKAAIAECRQAIQLSVDYDPAIEMLINICDTRSERIEQLRFVQQQLADQVIIGEGLQTFRHYASGTFDEEEILHIVSEGHAQRPDLWQCWSALTDQLLQMDHLDEAYSHATKASRAFPLMPRMWIDLANVCRARHDVEEQIEALMRAREINPTWGEPARELAVAYQQQDKLFRARDVMQRAVAIESREPRNHSVLGSILWELREYDAAIQQMRIAVRLEPGFESAWSTLQLWADESGNPELAINEARQLTRDRPNESQSWLILAEILDAPDYYQERMDAIEKAILANPLSSDAYAMKAHLLTTARCYEEAIAACNPGIFQARTPLQLQLQHAEILWQIGKTEDAFGLLDHVLQEDADYYFAWARLAKWSEQQDKLDTLKYAATNLTRIAPRHAVGWGYLGDACLRLGDRSQAMKHFAHAVALDPSYSFGISSLFDLQLADRQFPSARKTIESGSAGLGEGYIAAFEIRIAAALNDGKAASEALRRLCAILTDDDIGPLQMATRAMDEANMQHLCRETIAKEVRSLRASTVTGALAIEELAKAGMWSTCEQLLEDVKPRDDMWTYAAAKYVSYAAEDATEPKKFLDANYASLCQDDRTWAAIADTFQRLGDHEAVIRHCQDWRNRSDLSSFMLAPLAASYWSRKRIRPATAVSRMAMRRPRDSASSQHALWLAAAGTLINDIKTANNWIRQVAPDEIRNAPFFLSLYHTLQVVIDGCEGATSYDDCQQQLHRAGYLPAEHDASGLLRRLLLGFRRVLATHHNRRIAALWYRVMGSIQFVARYGRTGRVIEITAPPQPPR